MKNRTLVRAAIILAVFYLVGLTGFIIPATYQLFSRLTPVALLLSAVILILFHKPHFHAKTVVAFITIMILSFFIEVAGVKTGVIFGNYEYGKGLGPKFMETPLLIGLNWIMLVYCSKIMVDKHFRNVKIKIFVAPLIMVSYDLILELAAPELDMWHWQGGTVPVRNYIAWFLVALLFHIILNKLKISFSNKIAIPVFIVQFMFFLILVTYFSLFEQ
ncbi:MAG: carotenoid biosynthesis protein [Prolixibacteraceae bacterium]|nr:carotenoid biosynthesis protein [Prolixibacteraceae bacterium]